MNCNHCGAMRRAEGGLKIGGRALPTVVPGCPCTEFVRLTDDDDDHEINGITVADENFGGRKIDFARRMCTSDERTITPRLIEFTCDNYDLGLMPYVDVAITALDTNEAGCDIFDGPGIVGWAILHNGVDDNQSYSPNVIQGEGNIFRFSIYLNASGLEPFIDPPICNLKYRFERS